MSSITTTHERETAGKKGWRGHIPYIGVVGGGKGMKSADTSSPLEGLGRGVPEVGGGKLKRGEQEEKKKAVKDIFYAMNWR